MEKLATKKVNSFLSTATGAIAYVISDRLISSVIQSTPEPSYYVVLKNKFSKTYWHFKGFRRLHKPLLKSIYFALTHKTKVKRPTAISLITNILPIIVAAGVLISIASKAFGYKKRQKAQLWITSPSGKTTKQFPLYTALRIIRKQGWSFTPVVPTNSITRMVALKILLRGNRFE